jgi:sorting nexin-1/2
MSKYTSYKINTIVTAASAAFPFQNASVIRRYSDFVWLVTQLGNEFAGAVVCPLPEKQAVSRFNSEFVEGRRKQLERFLQRVAVHPELATADCLRVFLSADDIAFSLAKSTKVSDSSEASAGSGKGVMKWFKETTTALKSDLVKAPTDEQIREITEYVNALETQMKNVVTHTSSLVKKGKETANGLFEFGLAFTLLGQSESDDLGAALTQMGHTADTLSVLASTHSEQETENFEDPMVDYIRLIASVKAALAKRHDKKVTLSTVLADVTGKQASLAKLQGVPGKEDKVAQAEQGLKAAEEAAKVAQEDFETVDARVLREIERFKAEKAADMRKTVMDYINLQIAYNKRMEQVWQGLVPKLENVSVGGGSGVSSGGVEGGDDRVRTNSELYGGKAKDEDLVGV